MERYFCKCLNIIINVNHKETREAIGKDLIQIGLQGDVGNIDPFFGDKLLDVKLAISGIEVSQTPLRDERNYSDWLIYSCLNCGVDTHAMHVNKGPDRVLLSVDIPHGDEVLKGVRDSLIYSKFLKISLVDTKERQKNEVVGFTPNSMLEATEKLHNSCKKLIQAEEDAKNERIRIFTQKENQQFREYKMKANLDKERLLRTIRNYDTSRSSLDRIHHTMMSSNSTTGEERDVTTELPSFKAPTIMLPTASRKGMADDVAQPDGTFSLAETLSSRLTQNNNEKSGKSGRRKGNCHDDDILFDMEGYSNDKDCEPFFESDDESGGDATSLESSGGFCGSTGRTIATSGDRNRDGMKDAGKVYASSLPVPVPLFNNTRHSYDPESDDEMKTSPSLSKLAISFKQVAKSMQDSTGMFGDLPPRRKEHSSEMLNLCTDNYFMK